MNLDDWFQRIQDWQDSLCKSPKVHRINGKPITLLCMREKGHDGECMECLAAPEGKAMGDGQ